VLHCSTAYRRSSMNRCGDSIHGVPPLPWGRDPPHGCPSPLGVPTWAWRQPGSRPSPGMLSGCTPRFEVDAFQQNRLSRISAERKCLTPTRAARSTENRTRLGAAGVRGVNFRCQRALGPQPSAHGNLCLYLGDTRGPSGRPGTTACNLTDTARAAQGARQGARRNGTPLSGPESRRAADWPLLRR